MSITSRFARVHGDLTKKRKQDVRTPCVVETRATSQASLGGSSTAARYRVVGTLAKMAAKAVSPFTRDNFLVTTPEGQLLGVVSATAQNSVLAVAAVVGTVYPTAGLLLDAATTAASVQDSGGIGAARAFRPLLTGVVLALGLCRGWEAGTALACAAVAIKASADLNDLVFRYRERRDASLQRRVHEPAAAMQINASAPLVPTIERDATVTTSAAAEPADVPLPIPHGTITAVPDCVIDARTYVLRAACRANSTELSSAEIDRACTSRTARELLALGDDSALVRYLTSMSLPLRDATMAVVDYSRSSR